jgi:hypothetical protein
VNQLEDQIMSLLTPLLPARRRPEEPTGVAATPQEWHVGLSHEGMFPHSEARCPCAKAACGLAIPRPEIFCPVHQGPREYRQLHVASDCAFPRKGWFRRQSGLTLNR